MWAGDLSSPSLEVWAVGGDRLRAPSPRPLAPSPSPPAIGRAERVALVLLLGVGLALRAVWIARHGYDTDEAQHFHVAWGWANGRVQYRDLWDNHMPLFHLATAPLARAAGERADVLWLGRLAMIPLSLVVWWATYAIGARLFHRRVGLWAAAMLGVHAEFLNKSIEFRADGLWAAFWMLSLLVLVGGPWRPRRALAAGLLAGLAMATSLKTSLLLVTLAGAGVLVLLVSPAARARWSLRRDGPALGLYALGALAPAAIVFAAFAGAGILAPFLECTVSHNAGIHLQAHGGLGGGLAAFAGLLAALVAVAWGYARLPWDAAARPARLLLLAWMGLEVVTLETVWPVVAKQDVLPSAPVAAIGLAAALVLVAERLAGRGGVGRALPVGLLAAFAVIAAIRLPTHDVVGDTARIETSLLADVLRLTDRSDLVMDAKGETVFRDRAMRPVLELLTRERIRSGLLADPVADACVETRACVVALDHIPVFLERAWSFVRANYVPVGPLWVAGRLLGEPPPDGRAIEFSLAIPARYAVVSERGEVRAALDGVTYAGPRDLAAGPHTLVGGTGVGRVAVIWAQAPARGFLPFGVTGAPR